MGKASRTKQDASRRERITAQRAAQHRAQVRNRVLLASGAIVVVIAVVVAFIVVKAGSNTAKPSGASNGPTGAALARVVSDTTSVPASALDAVGAGSVTTKPAPVSGPPLTSGGKPEMLYIGADYCPYCAFERWGMIVALSRFGTFSGLHTVHSSSTDVFPNAPTYSFYGSTYTSKYLTFTPVEETTNIPQGNSYTPLQKPTPQQQALMAKYDPGLSIPFVDIGNRYKIVGASASPQVLDGKSWAAIAASLKDASSPVARAVDGTANYITAAICKLTNDQPASACTPTVRSLQAKM
jgi:thiol-disulfide isomerase/thioredoxin